MMDTIGFVAGSDPEVAAAMGRELDPPAPEHRADRQREHCFPGGHGRHGQRAHQQVCRGLPRQALLRRLPVCGRGGEHRHRTAPASCSAPSTPTSSPIRGAQANLAVYFALLDAGRYRHGHGSVPGRPPDPRFPREHVAARTTTLWPTAWTTTASSTTTPWPSRSIRSGPSCWWRAPPPIPGPSTLPRLAEIAHGYGAYAHGGYGPHCRPGGGRASTRTRCPTPMWSPPPPTRPCAAPAAA